jgi:hypothetical protein
MMDLDRYGEDVTFDALLKNQPFSVRCSFFGRSLFYNLFSWALSRDSYLLIANRFFPVPSIKDMYAEYYYKHYGDEDAYYEDEDEDSYYEDEDGYYGDEE